MSAVSQPTRRTLVKGAAWSVPVVAVGAGAPAVAASPNCQVTLSARCDGGALIFSWAYVSGGVGPGPETFTLTRTGDTNNPEAPVGMNGAIYAETASGGNVTVTPGGNPSTAPQDILRVPAPGANNGSSTYRLVGPCRNISNTVCGGFDGKTCLGTVDCA